LALKQGALKGIQGTVSLVQKKQESPIRAEGAPGRGIAEKGKKNKGCRLKGYNKGNQVI